MSAIEWTKKIYVYLFSAIGLVLVVIGAVQFINLGLKVYVFTKADSYYNYPAPLTVPEKGGQPVQQTDQKAVDEFQRNQLASQRQRDAANALAMIIVGAPLFLYHWTIVRKSQ